jgi:NADH dehydrogenase
MPVPPTKGYLLGKLVGFLHHDVTITYDEIRGLMVGLLCTNSLPMGKTKLSMWLNENAASVGLRYSNELKRRSDGVKPYEIL